MYPGMDRMTSELIPNEDVVASATSRYPFTVRFENDCFREGDLLMIPRTGERAFVSSRKPDGSFELDTRFVRHVTHHVVGTEMKWIDGWTDEDGYSTDGYWVERDVYEPLALPYYEVKNLRPVEGERLLNLGSVYRG